MRCPRILDRPAGEFSGPKLKSIAKLMKYAFTEGVIHSVPQAPLDRYHISQPVFPLSDIKADFRIQHSHAEV